jgi:hypothetical protein
VKNLDIQLNQKSEIDATYRTHYIRQPNS